MDSLRVTCNSCGTAAETFNYANPDSAVECGCCPEDHDHNGLCRPVTILARAFLAGFGTAGEGS
jgi:hypothetical protein